VAEFLREFARERDAHGSRGLLRKARQLLAIFTPSRGGEASRAELAAFRNEHPKLRGDPLGALQRGQLFFTFEPDDPAPSYLRAALGPAGERVCGLAIDYGHWDATLKRCVPLATSAAAGDDAYAARLLGENALAFYGERLRARISCAHFQLALTA
jgi:hypothetical protein